MNRRSLPSRLFCGAGAGAKRPTKNGCLLCPSLTETRSTYLQQVLVAAILLLGAEEERVRETGIKRKKERDRKRETHKKASQIESSHHLHVRVRPRPSLRLALPVLDDLLLLGPGLVRLEAGHVLGVRLQHDRRGALRRPSDGLVLLLLLLVVGAWHVK